MEYLKWSTEERVATITITRPPANALSTGLIKELDDVLEQIKSDNGVRVVVLHGEGKFFSAGADIKEFTQLLDGDDFSRLPRNGQEVFERIERFPKPIIAAIHGAALGGGLEFAMACHIRLVSEDAKLGLPELQLGLIPGFAGTQRLPRYVGAARAAEMMLTGEPISGLEAVQCGLANHAYPSEQLLESAYILARKIAMKSPISVQATLNLLSYTKTDQFNQGVDKEAELFAEVFGSEDAKEGIAAFLEKREPSFQGK